MNIYEFELFLSEDIIFKICYETNPEIEKLIRTGEIIINIQKLQILTTKNALDKIFYYLDDKEIKRLIKLQINKNY
jgi:hypothetical protein